jgi:hypothetical protein
MYLVRPITREAKQWVNENVDTEPWQWLRHNLVIDHHCINGILQGMVESELIMGRDFTICHS